MQIRTALVSTLTASALMALAGGAIAQQPYPVKPIRLITPFAPGGTTDKLARMVGQKLNDAWRQQVVVENRPGGNTVIGTEAVFRSPPDGYTLMLTSNTHVINPNLIKTPYDSIRDFAPVAPVSSSEQLMVVHPSLPVKSLTELIALAKARPGQLNYSTTGSGGMTHLAGELFSIIAGVRMQQVPYKGSAAALTALISGEVELSISTPLAIIPHVKTGRLKALAVSGEKRLAALPQVPTFTQAGLRGFDGKSWYGILAPAGTPKETIDRLAAEIHKSLGMPDVIAMLVNDGMEPFILSPEQFAALMRADLAKFAKIIKTANIRFEN